MFLPLADSGVKISDVCIRIYSILIREYYITLPTKAPMRLINVAGLLICVKSIKAYVRLSNTACPLKQLSVFIYVNIYWSACLHMFVLCALLSQALRQHLSSRLRTVSTHTHRHTRHIVRVASGCCSHIRQYGNRSLTPIMQKRWELVAKPDISVGCCFSSASSIPQGSVWVCV